MKFSAKQRGQIILVVLMVMVVGLTIGLSLATRSVTDIKISTQMEKSTEAFTAAESGVESALRGGEYSINNCNITPTPAPKILGNTSYSVCVTEAGNTDKPLLLGRIGVADTYTVWLVWHKTDGSLDFPMPIKTPYPASSIGVCWGTGTETMETPAKPIPALEITSVYYDSATANYQVNRGAYDPSGVTAASGSNNFTDASVSGVSCTDTGAYYGTKFCLYGGTSGTSPNCNLATGKVPLILRLRPYYLNPDINQDTPIGLVPAALLPGQGINISSTGTAGDSVRKVNVVSAYPSLPAIFDYVLFSGTGVEK